MANKHKSLARMAMPTILDRPYGYACGCGQSQWIDAVNPNRPKHLISLSMINWHDHPPYLGLWEPLSIHFLPKAALLPTAGVAKIRKTFQRYSARAVRAAFLRLGRIRKISQSRDEKQFLEAPLWKW